MRMREIKNSTRILRANPSNVTPTRRNANVQSRWPIQILFLSSFPVSSPYRHIHQLVLLFDVDTTRGKGVQSTPKWITHFNGYHLSGPV